MHEACGHGGAGIDDVNITKVHVAFLADMADMATAAVRWVTSLDIMTCNAKHRRNHALHCCANASTFLPRNKLTHTVASCNVHPCMQVDANSVLHLEMAPALAGEF
jgi:hypothetical protein